MRLATCTPVDFESNEHFFGRDSGLLCRGLAAAGAESFVIMPGQSTPDDAPDLIRCRPQDLESEDWWRTQHLDGVVLYAWGDPEYIEVARAIRLAGIPLIQSLDTAGLPTPFGNFKDWWQCRIGMAALPQSPWSRLRPLLRGVLDCMPFLYERKRLAMLTESDGLAAISPPALDSIRTYLKALGRENLANKLLLIPHPVLPGMSYEGETKENRVIVVGRWSPSDHAQKNPERTIEVLFHFLSAHPDWMAEVIGRNSTSLDPLTKGWEPKVRNRLQWSEHLSHDELMARYRRSRILLCASRYESYHIASAEAVCSGCSVVVGKHSLLASTAWFTSMKSGTVAHTSNASDLAAALRTEAKAWACNQRNPSEISEHWKAKLHAPFCGRSIKDWFESKSA